MKRRRRQSYTQCDPQHTQNKTQHICGSARQLYNRLYSAARATKKRQSNKKVVSAQSHTVSNTVVGPTARQTTVSETLCGRTDRYSQTASHNGDGIHAMAASRGPMQLGVHRGAEQHCQAAIHTAVSRQRPIDSLNPLRLQPAEG